MFVLGNEKLSGYHGSVAIDRKQLPANADVLQQMVLDLIAQRKPVSLGAAVRCRRI